MIQFIDPFASLLLDRSASRPAVRTEEQGPDGQLKPSDACKNYSPPCTPLFRAAGPGFGVRREAGRHRLVSPFLHLRELRSKKGTQPK